MTFEKSCGAIVFRKFHGNCEVVLIKHVNGGHWAFPKGHVEIGETETQTAIREIKEETGVDVIIDSSFREVVSYSPKKDTKKDVVYFLAKAKNYNLVPQEDEISQIKWVEITVAQSLLTYDKDKKLINKAKSIIKESY